MLGHRRRRLQEISFAMDGIAGMALLGLVFTFLLLFPGEWQAFLQRATGYPFRVNTVTHLVDNSWVLLLMQLCMLLAQRLTGFYTVDLGAGWRELALASVRGSACGVAGTALLLFLIGFTDFNRSLLVLFGLAFFAYQVPKELLLRRWWVNRSRNRLHALLIGGEEDLQQRLPGPKAAGVQVKAVIAEAGVRIPPQFTHLVAEGGDTVAGLLARGGFDVVLLGNDVTAETAQAVLAAAEEQGVEVWYFSRFPIPKTAVLLGDDFAGQPVLVFKTASRYESRLAVKRAVDLCGAVVLLLLLAPLMLAVALAIKFTSHGPVFYVQERTGWRGRTFRILKFRSMYADAEVRQDAVRESNRLAGPVFKAVDDPRVTRLGRWLRKYSIDELPQLINVLRGEMSLVGPRPLPVYETSRLPAFGDYRRLSVLPGMTGLWQVSGRANIVNFEDWVRLDLQYIDQWSLWLDTRILLKTLPAVLRGWGAQ